ncbi:MAG: hypothetical protein IKZ82_01905 [Clostridia bacterium]|nr:hypothetical protein [Clostridia bacterium]
MKKFLLIIGVALIAASILALLFAALNRYGYYHALDGSALHFVKLYRRMTVSFIVGLGLAVLGVACIIIRTKL